jgi:hypothetical protein
MLYSISLFLPFYMDFGIAETGIARGSPPGTTTEVLRFGIPSAEIRVVSAGPDAEVLHGAVSPVERAELRCQPRGHMPAASPSCSAGPRHQPG